MTTSITPPCSRRIARSPAKRFASLFLLLVLAAPATALAGKAEDAKAHVAKATKAHKEGRYEDALAELEAAYALDPRPDLLYAIGQVHAKLGNCREASVYFKRFGATQKDPRVTKVVDDAIAACKPEPAEPAPDATPPSPDAPPDQPVTNPTPDKPPPTPSQPSTAKPAPQPFARTKSEPAPVAASQPVPWYKDRLGDGLVLGGVIAGVVGLVEYSSARSDLDAAETATPIARYRELVDSAHGKRTASVVLFVAGGGLITAGVARYVLHDRNTETRGVAVAPTRGGGMVTYQGSF